MAVIGDLLFYAGRGRAALSDVLRHNLESGVGQAVDRISANDFATKSDDELVNAVVEQCRGEPLYLHLTKADSDVQETSVEVRDHFSGMVRVPGLSVKKIVPFEGEAAYFTLTPNSFDMNPPRGEVRGQKLVVGMEVTEQESEAAVQHIDETLGKVQTYIDRQKPQIEEHNRQLPNVARAAIERRRASLGKASDLANRLRGRP